MSGGRQITVPRPGRDQQAPSDPGRRARRCRRKFLEYFPDGFRDETYLETERAYKWDAHRSWLDEIAPLLDRPSTLSAKDSVDIARRIVRIESRTNLLFSFEKMALRDATSSTQGARLFVKGLTEWLHADRVDAESFNRWRDTVAELPRRQTRVVTWPIITVFGFVAKPRTHMFLKPNVMRHAAEAYGYPLAYTSPPQWATYQSVLDFARVVRRDLQDLGPRDMIDIQSFLWVQGSDEYE